MNAKRKDWRNERGTAGILEALGCTTPRAAAGLGAWDIIGIEPVEVVLVRVNTPDWPGSTEVDQL